MLISKYGKYRKQIQNSFYLETLIDNSSKGTAKEPAIK